MFMKPFENTNCYLKAKYAYSTEDKCNLGVACPGRWNSLVLLKLENLINIWHLLKIHTLTLFWSNTIFMDFVTES